MTSVMGKDQPDNRVTIFEVAPRDGLQNEKTLIATSDKITLVNELTACGFNKIEVTSFVSPKWVPQMADAAEVMEGMERAEGVSYGVLTPNLKGFERAAAARASEVGIFAAASEGFSKANINCTIAESLERFQPVMDAARVASIPVRAAVSCMTDCPYEGATDPGTVVYVAKALADMGCYEIGLADTIGAATPEKTATVLDAVLEVLPAERLAGHFHDTNGRALENIEVCLDRGLRVFDASVGGLGGCPYAPGATGNVATEAVLDRLNALGFETGLDLERVSAVGRFARSLRR